MLFSDHLDDSSKFKFSIITVWWLTGLASANPASQPSEISSSGTQANNSELKLRVFIVGGGCSGFQYGFTFDESLQDDDTAVEEDGATVVIDAMSFQYLMGSELDYMEGLEGSRFVVNNPNATTTCGCGASFSI